MEVKDKIKQAIETANKEINVCNNYLKDLPEDIETIDELDEIIGNNKDMSRAYDLGRRDTLKEIHELLQELKDM